ncbi:hypothetical protein SAMN02910289_02032 [Lachnospiraceae bacterium RM5]|nr:hypothetical protein SAMN02910289_02032 [Lachnospiraceae bacterium RM5]
MDKLKIKKIIRSIMFVILVSICIFANKDINVMADDTEEYTSEECFVTVKDFQGSYYIWYYSDDVGYEVSRKAGYGPYPGMCIQKFDNIYRSEHINIPEEINGENVTSIVGGQDIFKDDVIRGIKIPNTLRWIYPGYINYGGDPDEGEEYQIYNMFDNCENIESIVFTENCEIFSNSNINDFFTIYESYNPYEKKKVLWPKKIPICLYGYNNKNINLFVIKDKNGFTRTGESSFRDLDIFGAYTYLERGAGDFNEDDFDVIFEFVEGEDSIRILKINNKVATMNFSDGTVYIDGKDYNVILSEDVELLKPSVMTVPLSNSTVKLYWENVPFAKGYQLYKYYPSTKTIVKSKYVEKTSTRFNGLKPDKTYYYIVQAIGENGITSGEVNKNQAIYVTTNVEGNSEPLDNLQILSWRGKNGIYKHSFFEYDTYEDDYGLCIRFHLDYRMYEKVKLRRYNINPDGSTTNDGYLIPTYHNWNTKKYYYDIRFYPYMKNLYNNTCIGTLITRDYYKKGDIYMGGNLINYKYFDGYQ